MPDVDLNSILGMAQRVQQEMQRVQAELANRTVEASAGGGMVTAVASGAREIVRITIDPQAIDLKDVGMLQDLVVAACNAALRKAQELARAEMAKATGGLPIPPGLF
ncbi:MAG TPA: YbaB/EbfC family nucleoid-associated protein [Polyangia bacterium]|nr:YbaB/EbfC family nucleoid-associated protein [Polyangia bacterium]